MEDDGCPRLAPPPKPTLQEMTQAKPVVPEVSLLLSGYDNSYSWHTQTTTTTQTAAAAPKVHTHTLPHTLQSDQRKMEEIQLTHTLQSGQRKQETRLPYTLPSNQRRDEIQLPRTQESNQNKQETRLPYTLPSNQRREGIQLIENVHRLMREQQGSNSSGYKHSPPATTVSPVSVPNMSLNRVRYDMPRDNKCYNPLAYSPSPKHVTSKPSAVMPTTTTTTTPFQNNIHHHRTTSATTTTTTPFQNNIHNRVPKRVASTQQHVNYQSSPDHLFSPQVMMRAVENTVTSHQATNQQHTPPTLTSISTTAPTVKFIPAMGQKNKGHINSNRYNKENITMSSSLAGQVPPRQTNIIDGGGVQEMNVNTGGIIYPQTSIPSSQSNQTTTTPSTQNIRPNFPGKRVQVLENPGNTTPSSDHFMYQLIEDNNHQIKTLSKTIEMLMARQTEGDLTTTTPEREHTHKVLYARGTLGHNNNNNNNNNNDKGVQKEVSAQTVPSEPLLETRSIGVNTDISWSELVASIRNDNNNNSNSTPHSPPLIRTNRCINNDLRPNNNNNRQTLNQETTLDHFTRHNNNNSNNIQTTHNNNNNNNRQTLNRQTNQNENEDEEEEEENGQILVHRDPTTTNILTSREQEEEEEEEEEQEKEFQALHPPPLPLLPKQLLPSHVVSCVGASGGGGGNSSPLHTLRNVGNEGVSQEAAHCVMLRESVATSHPGNQTDVPSPGRNFYDNILANIQHILQNSDAANEITQQQQQQQQQLDHPQQSAPQRERRPLGESHVEALREQLIQFGISFMEPGTHTDQPQGTMDTMYLPRVHNMLSMYQSAISTHYHPGQPRLDATTAKYLTDSQLAAIAAKSSVTVSQDASRRTQVTNSHSPSTNTNTTQEEAAAASQLYRFTVSNNVSMSSINFLEKYGLKEDQ